MSFDDTRCYRCNRELPETTEQNEAHTFEGYCSSACQKGESIIDLAGVAAVVSAARPTLPSIQKRLFKDTECGISFYADQRGVTVAGYVEGWDGECPPTHLPWGFTEQQLLDTIDAVDREGCEIWDEVHKADG